MKDKILMKIGSNETGQEDLILLTSGQKDFLSWLNKKYLDEDIYFYEVESIPIPIEFKEKGE